MKIYISLLNSLVLLLSFTAMLRADDQARMNELVKQRDEARAKAKAADKEIAALAAKMNGTPVPPEPPEGASAEINPFAIPQQYNLKIRQTLADKNKNSLPALLQYTHPGNGSDSYLVDMGVSLSHDLLLGNAPASAGLAAEYHYNSASGKLKDSFSAGLTLDAELGSDTKHAQLVRATASYKRDNLVSGEGAQGEILWYPSLSPRVDETGTASSFAFGGFYVPIGDFFKGRIEPYIGLQGETGNGASKDFKDGDRFSGHSGVSLKGVLLPKVFANRLELNTSVDYWRHFTTSGGFEQYDDDQLYYSAAATYWFDTFDKNKNGLLDEDEKHFGITVRYVNGDNPTEGDFNADTWTIGFAIQF